MKPSTKILTDAQLQAAAVLRVETALALIERAQNDLASACAELSTLCGGCSVWKSTSSMTDKVKAHWYRVRDFRIAGRFYLDPMHVELEEPRFLQRVVKPTGVNR
jgi:hypothetical protein